MAGDFTLVKAQLRDLKSRRCGAGPSESVCDHAWGVPLSSLSVRVRACSVGRSALRPSSSRVRHAGGARRCSVRAAMQRHARARSALHTVARHMFHHFVTATKMSSLSRSADGACRRRRLRGRQRHVAVERGLHATIITPNPRTARNPKRFSRLLSRLTFPMVRAQQVYDESLVRTR
jgi:hypothetical protein